MLRLDRSLRRPLVIAAATLLLLFLVYPNLSVPFHGSPGMIEEYDTPGKSKTSPIAANIGGGVKMIRPQEEDVDLLKKEIDKLKEKLEKQEKQLKQKEEDDKPDDIKKPEDYDASNVHSPEYKEKLPTINPNDDLDISLKTLGLRRFDSSKVFEPEMQKSKHYKPVDTNCFVGNILHEDWITDRPHKLICAETMYATGEKGAAISASAAVELTDPRLLDDLNAYLERTGYSKYASTRRMEYWFRFSGSATWLPKDNRYLVVSRYFYTEGERDKPVYSIMRLQLYDPDWQEVFDERLRFVDADDDVVRAALKEYSTASNNNGKEKALDQISLKFPVFMHVPFASENPANFMGPEDPRISYRPSSTYEEPVVFFNMRTKNGERKMYTSFPLRTPKEGVFYHVELLHGGDNLPVEKNWTPFFEKADSAMEKGSYGFAHFVYSFDRFVVVRCNLDNGECETVQDERSLPEKFQVGDRSYPRGASNFVPFPEELMKSIRPEGTDLDLWLAFAKTHAERTGCGHAVYRPIMTVMAKLSGAYTIALYGENTEMGVHVRGWDNDMTYCAGEGPNVLSPNSIAYWKVTENSDYLDLTLSEADRLDERVALNGTASYLKSVFAKHPFKKEITHPSKRARMIANCISDSAYRYGIVYRAHNIAPKDYKEKMKKAKNDKKKVEEETKKVEQEEDELEKPTIKGTTDKEGEEIDKEVAQVDKELDEIKAQEKEIKKQEAKIKAEEERLEKDSKGTNEGRAKKADPK